MGCSRSVSNQIFFCLMCMVTLFSCAKHYTLGANNDDTVASGGDSGGSGGNGGAAIIRNIGGAVGNGGSSGAAESGDNSGTSGIVGTGGTGGTGSIGGTGGAATTDVIGGTGGTNPIGETAGPFSSTPPKAQLELAALIPVDNCDHLLQLLRVKAQLVSESTVDANLQQVLDMKRWGFVCPPSWENLDLMSIPTDLPSIASPADLLSEDNRASEYSTTNVQEVGVDEADFIKNDGAYIYIVADGQLQIIDAWPAANTQRISSVEIPGTPKKLFVYDNDGDEQSDLAVVYSSMESLEQEYIDPFTDMFGPLIRPWPNIPDYQKECTYGYSCEFEGDGRALMVAIYDISDKLQPVLLRNIEFNGSYLSSRRIDNIIHTVVTLPEVTLPGIVDWPQELQNHWDQCQDDGGGTIPYTEQELTTMFEELKAQNSEVIYNSSIEDYLPGFKDTRIVNGQQMVKEGRLEDCSHILVAQEADGIGLLSLVSFELDEINDIGVDTIVSKPGAVYASTESLYVAVRHYNSMMGSWYYDELEQVSEATTVHKFSLAPGSIQTEYRGSGVVKGRILNQFSMDEQNGYLRIATTTDRAPSNSAHSTLSVLAEQQEALRVVGFVDGIGPSEDIRSARFNGDMGYLVTFKKTDPLFVVDLSDPEDPFIKGELKIPGYSTYMHIMDDTHLLTIGYDTDDLGDFAWFQGIQFQIIDVSDPTDPQLIQKIVTGLRGSSSEAATDHLAFNYFPERDLMAIPMTVCEGSSGGGGSYSQKMTFSGLLVYEVTIDEGFSPVGGISHKPPETEYSDSGMCHNWWTDSNSVVKRSIFMADSSDTFVYSIALDLIHVSKLDDLEHPLSSVQLLSGQ